jgi:hypothetical protein
MAEYESYHESYRWRKNNKYIVDAKYIIELKKKDICTSFHYASIYIERIPIRLF